MSGLPFVVPEENTFFEPHETVKIQDPKEVSGAPIQVSPQSWVSPCDINQIATKTNFADPRDPFSASPE